LHGHVYCIAGRKWEEFGVVTDWIDEGMGFNIVFKSLER